MDKTSALDTTRLKKAADIMPDRILLHLQDLFAWILLVLTATGSLFGIWLFVDTLVTYASRRIR